MKTDDVDITLNNTELFKDAFIETLRFMYTDKLHKYFAVDSLIKSPFFCLAVTRRIELKERLRELNHIGRGLYNGYERAVEKPISDAKEELGHWVDYIKENKRNIYNCNRIRFYG